MILSQLILFAEDFHASLFPSPGSKQARKMTATSGRKCLGLYAKSGPVGCLARTLLESLEWHSILYFLIWRVKATPHKHLLYQLVPQTPPTGETGFGLWRTPDANCDRGAASRKRMKWKVEKAMPISINDQVRHGKMWPAPTVADTFTDKLKSSQQKPGSKHSVTLAQAARKGCGQLNPDWVECLMGLPVGWTNPEAEPLQHHPWPALFGQEQYDWEPPRLGRNIPNRAKRLKALGNAVVPQVAEIIGKAIMKAEEAAP